MLKFEEKDFLPSYLMFEVPFRQLSDLELANIAKRGNVSVSFAANFFKHQFFAEPVSEEMMEELAKLHGMSLADFVPFFEGMQASYQDQENQLLEEAGVMVCAYCQCPLNVWLPEWPSV